MGRCPIGGSAGGFPRGRQKRGLGAKFQVETAQEIETFLGQHTLQGIDFEALETAAPWAGPAVGARALVGCLNADTSDYVGPQLSCSCGQWAHYRGRHEKGFE